MVEHYASVIVNAPVHQVYELFTHFNDFPKFMRFVKEVTYYDNQRSHWVVQVLNQYEWDAVNEDWIPDRQIGWRSTRGLNNAGKVKFRDAGALRTAIDVYIHYIPPTGPLGTIGVTLGISSYFDTILQEDLNHFARMVEQAPSGALDPMSSHYLFHSSSAHTLGKTTNRQQASMEKDPMMSQEALAERKARVEREAAVQRQAELEQETVKQRVAAMKRAAWLEHQAVLQREEMKRREEKKARETAPLQQLPTIPEKRLVALNRVVLGDRDAIRTRAPGHEQDPMTARYPLIAQNSAQSSSNDPTIPL